VTSTELGGVTIPGGAPVGSLVSSANRDETKFADPDHFDIFRPRSVNLAFGTGRHFCAGHAFSRAQVRITIEALIRRFPGLALDPERPPEFLGWEFRAPRRLDVLL
jgi:cytochrome P450